jgi:hypothetical protein
VLCCRALCIHTSLTTQRYLERSGLVCWDSWELGRKQMRPRHVQYQSHRWHSTVGCTPLPRWHGRMEHAGLIWYSDEIDIFARNWHLDVATDCYMVMSELLDAAFVKGFSNFFYFRRRPTKLFLSFRPGNYVRSRQDELSNVRTRLASTIL